MELDALGLIDWALRMRTEECKAFLGLEEAFYDTVWMEIGSSVVEDEAESVHFLRRVFEREEDWP